MELVKQAYLKGERALFKSHDLKVEDSIFTDGESPLKESDHIDISGSIFKWKYPLWYCNHINVENSTLLETARSGIWYTHHINIKDSVIDAPKTFRRGTHISLENVNMVNAQETLWKCSDIKLYNVVAKGDYFGMNSENIEIDGVKIAFSNTGAEYYGGCGYVTAISDKEYLVFATRGNSTFTFNGKTIKSVEQGLYVDNQWKCEKELSVSNGRVAISNELANKGCIFKIEVS